MFNKRIRTNISGQAMTILTVSEDAYLIECFAAAAEKFNVTFRVFGEESDVFQIYIQICRHVPSVLIIDDDYTRPDSHRLLQAVREPYPNMLFIFIASRFRMETVRSISPLGIHYFGMKPLSRHELYDLFTSMVQMCKKWQTKRFSI